MFARFTDGARAAVVLAQEESRVLNHAHIGTEHILLGFLYQSDEIAAMSLEEAGVDLVTARLEVQELTGNVVQAEVPTGHIPFTPRSKKVMELALREALQLGHNYIGTGHLLLGLIREGGGMAVQVLLKLRVVPHELRKTVIRNLGEGREGEASGGMFEVSTAERDLLLLALGAYQLIQKELTDAVTREAVEADATYEERRVLTDPIDAKRQEIVALASKVRDSGFKGWEIDDIVDTAGIATQEDA